MKMCFFLSRLGKLLSTMLQKFSLGLLVNGLHGSLFKQELLLHSFARFFEKVKLELSDMA